MQFKYDYTGSPLLRWCFTSLQMVDDRVVVHYCHLLELLMHCNVNFSLRGRTFPSLLRTSEVNPANNNLFYSSFNKTNKQTKNNPRILFMYSEKIIFFYVWLFFNLNSTERFYLHVFTCLCTVSIDIPGQGPLQESWTVPVGLQNDLQQGTHVHRSAPTIRMRLQEEDTRARCVETCA